MVYLYYKSCLRYTILVGNSRNEGGKKGEKEGREAGVRSREGRKNITLEGRKGRRLTG